MPEKSGRVVQRQASAPCSQYFGHLAAVQVNLRVSLNRPCIPDAAYALPLFFGEPFAGRAIAVDTLVELNV